MKIFKYSWKNGKGKHIANVKYSGCGCVIGKYKNYDVHEYFSTISYDENNQPVWQEKLTADDFDSKEAILFCTGKIDGEWIWIIIPNKEMVDKAKKRNQKQFGFDYYKKTL